MVEPLDPAAHGDALHAAGHDGGDPELWSHLPYGPFPERADFDAWLAERASGDELLVHAIVDRATGRAGGVAALMRIVPEHGTIEIGHIWLGAALQRTPQASEAIFLLARHAFDDLGYRRLEWKCDHANARSRRAAERFGFIYEGTFRRHLVIKGRNRDTAWFAITDGEWPAVRAGFERWLAAENFDSDGCQRETLEALRAAIR